MNKLEKVDKKEVALKIVNERGILIKHLKQWQDDKDVVIAAVTSFPFALEFVSERLRGDKDVVSAAIQTEPRVLSFATKDIYDNDKIREEAFEINNRPFIVNPEAFNEFVFQDALMMRRVLRTRFVFHQNGKRSWDKSNYAKALNENEFYKTFKKYYCPDENLTAADIKRFERELLEMRLLRLGDNKGNTILDNNEF